MITQISLPYNSPYFSQTVDADKGSPARFLPISHSFFILFSHMLSCEERVGADFIFVSYKIIHMMPEQLSLSHTHINRILLLLYVLKAQGNREYDTVGSITMSVAGEAILLKGQEITTVAGFH